MIKAAASAACRKAFQADTQSATGAASPTAPKYVYLESIDKNLPFLYGFLCKDNTLNHGIDSCCTQEKLGQTQCHRTKFAALEGWKPQEVKHGVIKLFLAVLNFVRAIEFMIWPLAPPIAKHRLWRPFGLVISFDA